MSDSHSPDDSPPKCISPQPPSSLTFATATAPDGSLAGDTVSVLPFQERSVASSPTATSPSHLRNTATTISHQLNCSEQLDPFEEDEEFFFLDEEDDSFEIFNHTPKPKKRWPSRRRHQAKRKAIAIIDKVWELCSTDVNGAENGQQRRDQTKIENRKYVGSAAIPEQKSRNSSSSYPVYRLRTGLYLVAATRADYREFKRLQGRTSARKTITCFRKFVLLPRHRRPSSYIKVDMPSAAHDYLATLVNNFQLALSEQMWVYNGAQLRYLNTGGGGESQ